MGHFQRFRLSILGLIAVVVAITALGVGPASASSLAGPRIECSTSDTACDIDRDFIPSTVEEMLLDHESVHSTQWATVPFFGLFYLGAYAGGWMAHGSERMAGCNIWEQLAGYKKGRYSRCL